MLAVALLVAGVAGAIARPRGLPAWAAPTAAAAAGWAVGALGHPSASIRPLLSPITFLLAAVPLAALLDRLGFFAAAASVLGRGEHLAAGLWAFGALVTTVLNLDASVVLLTPLYVQIARRRGLDPVALAFQPVLLSCLASSALPVSNLTNLIVASDRHLHAGDFLAHLAPSSAAATIVGWFVYRRCFPLTPTASAPAEGADIRALTVGGIVVGGVLIGFILGPAVGLPEWGTALIADAALMVATRQVPRRAVPWGTALVAGSLGVLAGGAAGHLQLRTLLTGSGDLDLARIAVVAAAGANLVNNLPALLVALRYTSGGIWALLIGVNVGPLVLVTGSLAALLWQASLVGMGIQVTGRQFARVGLRVLVPALAAAVATLLALRPVVGP